MIFYMTQIFTSNDIRLIVKILMIKINIGEKSISKLSYELLDLIRKKWKIEDKMILNIQKVSKKSFNEEFILAFIHGILHLLGYDHDDKKKEEVMFSLQNKILQKVCK